MTPSRIIQIFTENIEYFERINCGKEFSSRYEDFLHDGIRRDVLKHKMITSPFSEEQVDLVIELLQKMLGFETVQQEMNFSNYLWLVMIPEVLIKVH